MSDAETSRFAILLDGTLTPTPRLRRQIEGRRVIAADGGIRHAPPLGVAPEIWLGDFDSSDGLAETDFADVPRKAYPTEKAISDGSIAIEYALDMGARDIVLAGALGGPRTDHALLNLSGAAALAAANPGISVTLTSGEEEALPLLPANPLAPDWPAGTLFSVIGFTTLDRLTVRDAKWPLDAVHVPFGSTWTLSNVSGESLEILLGEGCGIAICRLL